MANERHLNLSTTIKNIHQSLRDLSADVGPVEAWNQHLKDEETLKIYAKSMRELAETHWKQNATSEDRISWTVNFCEQYFQPVEIERWKQKDSKTIELLRNEGCENIPDGLYEYLAETKVENAFDKLNTLDVGSSGNFFKDCKRFNVLPIDISPSDDSVFFCDFLSVTIADKLQKIDKRIEGLPSNHFDVVIFCLLLEYMPSSSQRIKCCEKAYEVLRTEGVLIIITPDSNHESKNSKQIKNWRWTLSKIGFQRVKFEKLSNLTCLSFRKSVHPMIPKRWAEHHKEHYMEFKLEIPQDKVKSAKNEKKKFHEQAFDKELMNELPFECCY